MDDLFRSYWWLLFPIGAFVFGAWDRWLNYKRSRDQLDLIRTFAAQGKEVPPELMQQIRDEGAGPGPPPGYPPQGPDGPAAGPGYGPQGYWGGYWSSPRHMRRAWRGYYRWGPYWQWRRVLITGALAAGFWWAAMDGNWPGTYGPFRLVAIVMTVIFVGNLLSALLFSRFRDK